MTITLLVTINTEEDSVRAVENYVADAVSSWGGQFHPEDSLFNVDVLRCKRVTTSRLKEELRRLGADI